MRLADWQLNFEKFIAKYRHSPFVWGKHDCCLFAANSVLAITGKDYAESLRDSYDSVESAVKVIKQFGGIESIASSLTGISPVSASYADVGDVLLVLQCGREMLAVCNGSTMFAPGERGLITLETHTALKTWKI